LDEPLAKAPLVQGRRTAARRRVVPSAAIVVCAVKVQPPMHSVADAIPGYLEIKTEGLKKLKVENWRGALQKGFDAGFETATGPDSLGMSILRADLELVPGAVSGEGSIVAVGAQVTFKAQLQKADGQVVCTAATTATSKKTVTRASEMAELVSSAVESMYEIVAAKCLASGAEPGPG